MTRTPRIARLACIAAARQFGELKASCGGDTSSILARSLPDSSMCTAPAGVSDLESGTHHLGSDGMPFSPESFSVFEWREAIERELACRNLAYYLEHTL